MKQRPGQPIHRDIALRIAVITEQRARQEARRWVKHLPDQAGLVGRGQAERTLDSTGADPLRAALAREWFTRVFEDEARKQLHQVHPETAVTKTETEHGAECFRTGVAYRIHGPGGAVVLNQNSPITTPGQANLTDPDTPSAHPDPNSPAKDTWSQQDMWTQQELEALAARQDRRRAEEQQIVAAVWDQLSPEQRTAFATYWHREHDTTGPTTHPIVGSLAPTRTPDPARAKQSHATFTASSTGQQVPVTGPPPKAAAEVFAKPPPSIAETTAARALTAASFPHQKPTRISSTGQTRTDPMTRATDHGERVRNDTNRYPHSGHGPEL